VGLVTSRTTQSEGRLMKMRFLELLCLLAMASEAGIDWVGLYEAWSLSSMGIVASSAMALRSRMLEF